MEPTNLYIIVGTVFTVVIGFDVYNWAHNRSFDKPEFRIQRLRSTINFTMLVIGVTLVIVSAVFHVNIFNYSSPIEHQYAGTIALKDFKGYKRPSQTLDGTKEFAFITTSIEWTKSGDEFHVRALFHPARSYVYNKKVVDNLLLRHELYHFHITEYFARQIRKSLENLPSAASSETIQTAVKTYSLLEETMQMQYDDQTYHGYILKEQKRWQQKIDSLLFSHQKYSTTTIRH